MQILFRYDAPGFFSWMIRKASRSDVSHVEIRPKGHVCISSSEQDGGVRWAKWISGNPKKWRTYKVGGVADAQDRRVGVWCVSQIEKKYDWRGIFQWLWPHIRNKDGDLNKWYCSEFCQRALAIAFPELLNHPVKHPGGLERLLLELGIIVDKTIGDKNE
jgi:hypothetical protein